MYLKNELEASDTEGMSGDLTLVPMNSRHITRALTCIEGKTHATQMQFVILNSVPDSSMFVPCMSVKLLSTSWSSTVHLLIQSN
jgi:hypothetical protein